MDRRDGLAAQALDALWLLLPEAQADATEQLLHLIVCDYAAAHQLPAAVAGRLAHAPLPDALAAQLRACLPPCQEVEQIGAAYEALLGFEPQQALHPSLGLRPRGVVVAISAILAQPPARRRAWLREQTGCVLSATEARALRDATTPDGIASALRRKRSPRTPDVLAPGSWFLQPSAARRHSGSHYTPRERTTSIVAHTLSPLLSTRPAGTLRVCDPAMGSGAFLLEACRQLAAVTGSRREVATRCLFGVDRDPLAVTLARISVWLLVADPDLPVEAFDSTLRVGDALVGPAVFPAGGFDAMVGNPPFAGKNTLSAANPVGYRRALKRVFPHVHGNADLVAYFFLRAFALLRDGGCMGLIATNTINEGDTRDSGLAWICTHGGSIYRASRRVPWPGDAAVVVSEVFIHKGAWSGPRVLDGRGVARITAFLFHAGRDTAPPVRPENRGLSFQGSIVLGMGFTFDDTDRKGVATPLSELERLLAADPHNAERIAPYIGGAELNSSPTHAHHRHVINFGDLSEEDARSGWPMLMDIVEQKVKPGRLALPPKNAWNRDVARRWWQFGAHRVRLTAALRGRARVLATNAQASKHLAFAFLPAQAVFANSLNLFPVEHLGFFAILQSTVHEVWARFFGSSLEDRLRYNPTDCFETFPFPAGWQGDARLASAGRAYVSYRASLMADEAVRADVMGGLPPEGLTKTYNRFHDPACTLPGIVRLREARAALDAAVFSAYGWGAVFPSGFREGATGTRYRWSDAGHDEVLARLLALC